jgi:hypothetical protein
MHITKQDFAARVAKRMSAVDAKHKKQLDKLLNKQADEKAGLARDVKFKTMYELGETLIKQAGIAISSGILQPGLSGMVRPAYGDSFDKHPWHLELHYSGGMKQVPSRAGSTIRSFVGRDPDAGEAETATAEGLEKLKAVVEAAGLTYEVRHFPHIAFDHVLVVDLAKLVDA